LSLLDLNAIGVHVDDPLLRGPPDTLGIGHLGTHGWTIDVEGRQLLCVALRDVQADAVVDCGHGADRNSDFLAAPQMALLKEDMGYVVITRIENKPVDSPDGAVRGIDPLISSHLHLVQRDRVVSNGLRDVADDVFQAAKGLRKRHSGDVNRAPATSWQEFRLFRMVELVELRCRATEVNLPCGDVDKIQRNEAT
jgi:hypothetical protein